MVLSQSRSLVLRADKAEEYLRAVAIWRFIELKYQPKARQEIDRSM